MTGQVHPGALVRAWRERASLTQEQLAERAGLSARTIGRLESGDTGRLRTSSLELLSTALDLNDAERSTLAATARNAADPDLQPSPGDVPRQLPAPSPAFTGRVAELGDLDRVPDESAVVLTSIDGMAGIGKTALAVHAAHRLAVHYPDGQFFLDMHGYTEGVAPVDPDEALARMLRVLGVPDEGIPPGLDDRAALYRSRLAGRKALILLDDAADEAQVAPLVPGTAGCLVMVTSRRRLPGLDATHTFSLDVLPQRDAEDLFTSITEADRVAPALLAEVVELCDRLPLAIRIAAARLRARPAWTVLHLIERLRDHRRRLGELGAGLRSVTAALELSYRQLGPEERRAFRLLALHPGGDLDAYAAAALIGSTPAVAEELIDGLLEAHLVQEPSPGRYRFHDLVRAHAAAQRTPDRAEALTRLLDHYCHSASAAMDTAYPYERVRRPAPRPAGTPSPALGDEATAGAWLEVELPNLLAAARLAADHGWPDQLQHLSTTLHRHLRTRRRYADGEVLHERALTAARARRDRRAEAEALVGVGHMQRLQGRPERATESLRSALAAARACGHRPVEHDALILLGHLDRYRCRYGSARACFEEVLETAPVTGDRVAEMEALLGLGWVHLGCGHDVGDEFERALDLARALRHPIGEATALQAIGYAHRSHGRYEQAVDTFERSLRLARATRSPWSELSALVDLARIHRCQGRAEAAGDCYREVLDLTRETSSPAHEANAWYGLGRLHHAAGRTDQALVHHQRALELATELGLPALQAQTHDGLAHAHIALGRPDHAREHWNRALECLSGITVDHTLDDEVSTEAVRDRLDRMVGTG